MKCVSISDTHGMYREIEIPGGDILIHAGDILGRGSLKELRDFNEWIGEQPHKYKVVIAGNHDWCFENHNEVARMILTNAIYLQDESVDIEGVKIYGSPWQPWFFNWAFNLRTPEELKERWDLIPDDIDILITHGPPHGILDTVVEGDNVGCTELLKAVHRVKPKVHVFGHIHEGYGQEEHDGCTFINASINTRKYRPNNKPIIFEI